MNQTQELEVVSNMLLKWGELERTERRKWQILSSLAILLVLILLLIVSIFVQNLLTLVLIAPFLLIFLYKRGWQKHARWLKAQEHQFFVWKIAQEHDKKPANMRISPQAFEQCSCMIGGHGFTHEVNQDGSHFWTTQHGEGGERYATFNDALTSISDSQ